MQPAAPRSSRTSRPADTAAGADRWPAAVAVLLLGVLYAAIPSRLRFGPPWLLLAVAGAMLVPLFMARSKGNHALAHRLAQALTVLVTLADGSGVAFLVTRLPGGATPGTTLLRDAGLVWLVNVVVFALWYFEIDGGGPGHRHPGRYRSTDFVFPQFQQAAPGQAVRWVPELIDYLFLSFNTSTAFSPTDTLVLSKRAKVLMMGQALISLVVLAVLAARAINTL